MKPLGVLILVLAGCATSQSVTVGVSAYCAQPATSPSVSASASASESAPVPLNLQPVGSAFLSRGHFFARYQATISVSEDAASAYADLGPGSQMPEGAIVTERLQAPDDSQTLIMKKLAGAWSYFQVGRPDKVQAMLHPCIDCHAQRASQDNLFGHP